MAALATLVVVWLGAKDPEGRAKATLDDWAAARGTKLEPARSEPSDDGQASEDVATRCDHDLDEARDLSSGGDDRAARRTLARVEQTLRDHPEVLQASWIMAERCRLEAQLASRLGEDDEPWVRRADALEGSRAPAFGEVPRTAVAPSPITVGLAVRGARSHESYWDGQRTDDRFVTTPGEHHLAVLRGKQVAWSGWVSVLVATTLDVWIADAAPCSREDLAGSAFTGESSLSVPEGARCRAWAVAGPGPRPGTIRAAFCHGNTCDQAATWAYQVFDSTGRPPAASSKALPAWATWTIAGVGFAAATSLLMWRTGAFDRAEPPKKVVFDGSNL